jgi:hypothetical protein
VWQIKELIHEMEKKDLVPWVSILLLILLSITAESQILRNNDKANYRRPSSTPVTSAERSRTGFRVDPTFRRRTSRSIRKPNLLINARASATQDCGGLYCVSFTPLPVKLVDFYGVRLNPSEVQLRWKTAEEFNNDRFEVERTSNPASGFEVVGTVKGKNYSLQSTSYQLNDPNDAEQYTYYRLKQVDGDGSVTYSRIISVKGVTNMLSVVPSPNPATSDALKFQIYGHKPGESIHLLIYDVKGQRILQKTFDNLPEGKQISVEGMENKQGSFIVKINSGIQESSAHFVLVN